MRGIYVQLFLSSYWCQHAKFYYHFYSYVVIDILLWRVKPYAFSGVAIYKWYDMVCLWVATDTDKNPVFIIEVIFLFFTLRRHHLSYRWMVNARYRECFVSITVTSHGRHGIANRRENLKFCVKTLCIRIIDRWLRDSSYEVSFMSKHFYDDLMNKR